MPKILYREFDVIFHQFEEAKTVLTLCDALGFNYSFKFRPPKSGKVTIQEWGQHLGLTNEQLNRITVMDSQINNTNGQLIFKVQRNNKTQSKRFEAYL